MRVTPHAACVRLWVRMVCEGLRDGCEVRLCDPCVRASRVCQTCTGRFRERGADQPRAWEALLTLHMSPMKTSVDIDMAALLKATVEIDGSTTSLHEVLAAGTGDRTLMLFVRNGA